jgi:pimeloyl-[acyl-carrier protein] methyl ester esterase
MTPWVLLHGWGFHSAIWKDLVETLDAARDVRLIDLPGHGCAAKRASCSFDALVDEVAASAPRDAFVVGWSLGGLVAQRLAIRHPDRVRALALIATTPCFVARDGWPHGVPSAILETFAADLRRDPDGTLSRFVNLNAMGRDAARAATRRLGERPAASSAALDEGLALLRETDLREQTPALAMPALVIHGTRDRIVPVEAGRWLARTLPDARLLELPESAHLPFVSNRDAVRDALEAFDG